MTEVMNWSEGSSILKEPCACVCGDLCNCDEPQNWEGTAEQVVSELAADVLSTVSEEGLPQ